MLEELKKEVAEKEELIKIQLAREIQRLQEDKLKIENDIQGTHLFFQVIPSFYSLDCIQIQVLGVSIECCDLQSLFQGNCDVA
jgi:hypothetical protein